MPFRASKGLGNLKIHITDEDIEAIAAFSGGMRFCLNTLEMVVYNSPSELDGIHVSQDILKQCLQKRSLLYDKKGEEHYNIISALHKSVRNSDVQAAVLVGTYVQGWRRPFIYHKTRSYG